MCNRISGKLVKKQKIITITIKLILFSLLLYEDHLFSQYTHLFQFGLIEEA